MIVAICADKGSPGVTTATVALAMAWPGERLVVDADPAGGDLEFRARHPTTGGRIRSEGGLLALAADTRLTLSPEALPGYAQPTLWGVDVICGPPNATSYAPMRSLWPAVADTLAAWPGTAFADLGRLYPGTPTMALAHRSTVILVLTEVSVEHLFHLRGRVPELASQFGDPSQPVNPVAVVALARRRDAADAVQQISRVLESVGCPVPVLGSLAIDPGSAQRLREGQIWVRMGRGHLLRSAADVVDRVTERWPTLATADPAAATVAS
jgi:hypothetical protein